MTPLLRCVRHLYTRGLAHSQRRPRRASEHRAPDRDDGQQGLAGSTVERRLCRCVDQRQLRLGALGGSGRLGCSLWRRHLADSHLPARAGRLLVGTLIPPTPGGRSTVVNLVSPQRLGRRSHTQSARRGEPAGHYAGLDGNGTDEAVHQEQGWGNNSRH